jgi:uncharacterized repeat protein (TIGR01451 family)
MYMTSAIRRSGALYLAILASLASGVLSEPAIAQMAPPRDTTGKAGAAQLDMLDARANHASAYQHATLARSGSTQAGLANARSIGQSVAAAIASYRAKHPRTEFLISNLTGVPRVVNAKADALTAPAPAKSSDAIVRDFLANNAGLFGLTDTDLADLATLGDSAGGKQGVRMLRMEQRVDGIPVFQSETRFILKRDGSLVEILGQLVPDARGGAAQVDWSQALTAQAAAAELLNASGIAANEAQFSIVSDQNGQIELAQTNPGLGGNLTAKRVWFPLAPGLLVPAWSIVAFTTGDKDWYAIVDANTGDLLWRKNIRDYASTQDARFRVYVQADGTTPADSPAPQSPNTVTPGSGTQFNPIAPTIVSMHTAYDPVASPNGWIDDCPAGGCTASQTQTLGNNVLACVDQASPTNVCDTGAATVLDGNGRPTGNPDANGRNRDFLGTTPRDFQTGFLPPPQSAANPDAGQTATGDGSSGTAAIDQFRRGVTTHLFYSLNWYHDKLYELGFDEASGNFQQTNFSGMGVGNDRVLADVDDGSGTNNANFATPPDGTSGRMQMYRFTGPTIDRDGSLDAEVFMHEATHGVSNRLVGNAAGLNWNPARGMGEGWSDFVALSLLNNTNADDPNGRYASGAYATYKLNGYTDNYVYGIRRFPYSTDNSVDPLTWADVDDVTNDLSGGLTPPDPVGFNSSGGAEVHNIGEIWALTLWEVRSRIIADAAGANGDVPTGNHTMLQLVVDGLKMTPINPGFTDARDAILDADCATNGCANEDSIWGGFADRGLGYGAEAPYTIFGRYVSGHEGIHESFQVPHLDVVNVSADVAIDDSNSNNNGAIDPGEPVRLSVGLTNPWRSASKSVTAATATLSTSTPGVTIHQNTASYGAIPPQGTVAGTPFLISVDPGVACGSSLDFTLTAVSNLGTTATHFSLRLGQASGTDPVVTYTGAPSPDLVIPDAWPRGVFHQINVTDDLVIADLDFRINTVNHPGVGDLDFMLRSPDGIGVDLVSLIDGLYDLGGTSIVNMVIDGDVPRNAANDMVQAVSSNAPYTKSWSPVYNAPWAALVAPTLPADPVDNLARYDGRSTKGTWTTLAADVFSTSQGGTSGSGTLGGWSILVTPVHFACTAFTPSAALAATKTVAGKFNVGSTVTYTITLANNGTASQADNPGDELTDVLPAQLTLTGASASSGTVATSGNTVTWNGALGLLGGSTTITITATVNAATEGQSVSNQATFAYDADGNGSNESAGTSDDPGQPGANDATVFTVIDLIFADGFGGD